MPSNFCITFLLSLIRLWHVATRALAVKGIDLPSLLLTWLDIYYMRNTPT